MIRRVVRLRVRIGRDGDHELATRRRRQRDAGADNARYPYAATVADVANATGGNNRYVWEHLTRLVKEGYATRLGLNRIRYSLTDLGRQLNLSNPETQP